MDSLVLYAVAFLLFVYRVMCAKRGEIAFLIVFLAAGAALALYEGVDMLMMLLGILIFNGLASSYRSKANYAYFLLAAFFILPIYYAAEIVSQAMLLGFLSSAYLFMRRSRRTNASLERRRDVVQIILGLVFIAIFAFVQELYVRLLLISVVLLASLVGNFSISNGKNPVSKLLRSFERNGVVLGQGAMWLAVGALVAVSFLNSSGMLAVLVAIFIGDAAATLAGTSYRIPLPYNSKKSVAGTLAYFAVTAAISFPFVGYLGLLTGAVGALLESSPIGIDDNFDTAVVLTALLAFLGYASMAL